MGQRREGLERKSGHPLKGAAVFPQVIEAFMERFPKLMLLTSSMEADLPKKEEAALTSLERIEHLYVYGLADGSTYFSAKNWLHAKKERKLIFLEDELERVASFLHAPHALEMIEDPQVFFEEIFTGKALERNIEGLVDKWPSAQVEVTPLPSKDRRRFKSLRTLLLKKASLASALYRDRLQGVQIFGHFLENVRHIQGSFFANKLQGAFTNVPAFVCGAGPSLESAISHLKKLDDQALIIAGGSAIAALSSQGIIPHFGIGVDPNLEEYRRFKNSFAFEMPFLYSTRLEPKTFLTLNGPFGYLRSGIGGILEIWLEEELGLIEPLIGKDLSSESLSVTTICLAYAEFLGCNPIFLSGVDLAYTGGKRYAEGVGEKGDINLDELEEKKAALDRIVKRKNRKKEPVYTAVRWLMEANAISDYAKKHPKIQFFNTSLEGLGFSKIPDISLEEAISCHLGKRYDLKRRIHQEIVNAPMPLHTKEIIDKTLHELKESLDRVVAQLSLLKEGGKGAFLAEYELKEEAAYDYLFYDTLNLLKKTVPEGEIWQAFYTFATKYQAIFHEKLVVLNKNS